MLHQLSGNDSGGAGDAIIVQRFDAKMFKFQIMNEVTVFISYSHDSDAHRERVLGLSERLRQDGIPTLLFIVPTLPRGNAAFTAPAVRYLRRWSVAGGIPTQSVGTIQSTKTELNSPRKSRTIPSQITLPSTSLAFGMRCSLLGFT